MLDIKNSDYLIAFCTLLGPLLAVQAQKYLERWREREARKLAIFRTMMSTRATRLSSQHVEALNAIPIEFYGKKKVLNAWGEYFQHLAVEHPSLSPDLVFSQRLDLFNRLLSVLSQQMKYEFNAVELSQIYYPTGHVEIERAQEVLRRGVVSMMEGKFALPMTIKEFPFSAEATDTQMAANKAIIELADWLKGERRENRE